MSGGEQIEFQIFGRREADGTDDVRASVFVKKLDGLLKALQAADKHAHGKKQFQYFITDLRHGSAYAAIQERPARDNPIVSSIQTVESTLTSVSEGRGFSKDLDPRVVRAVAHIADGAGKSFSHSEVVVGQRNNNIIRLDQFYQKKAYRALKEYEAIQAKSAYFEGTVYSSFDGQLLEVDLRGQTAKAKLVLSVGGVELDCTCNSVTVENLRDALNQKVTVFALAHYDGKSRLPEHLTIKKINIIGADRSLDRWMGKFDLDYPDAEDIW